MPDEVAVVKPENPNYERFRSKWQKEQGSFEIDGSLWQAVADGDHYNFVRIGGSSLGDTYTNHSFGG
jgi:hypothetical protein